MTVRSISTLPPIFMRSHKVRRVRVSGGFWVILALAAVISPAMVVAAILSASVLHEAGHLAAMRRFGVRVETLRLTALGAELSAPALARLSYGRELIVTLAGVGVNLICAVPLALLGERLHDERWFLFAGAHLLLAAFNLLPIRPLDGGRALYLIAAFFFGPMVGDAAAAIAGMLTALALCALGAHVSLGLRSGYLFAFAALWLLCEAAGQLGLAKGVVKV